MPSFSIIWSKVIMGRLIEDPILAECMQALQIEHLFSVLGTTKHELSSVHNTPAGTLLCCQ